MSLLVSQSLLHYRYYKVIEDIFMCDFCMSLVADGCVDNYVSWQQFLVLNWINAYTSV